MSRSRRQMPYCPFPRVGATVTEKILPRLSPSMWQDELHVLETLRATGHFAPSPIHCHLHGAAGAAGAQKASGCTREVRRRRYVRPGRNTKRKEWRREYRIGRIEQHGRSTNTRTVPRKTSKPAVSGFRSARVDFFPQVRTLGKTC